MARPIEGIRPLTGKAARWLLDYLKGVEAGTILPNFGRKPPESKIEVLPLQRPEV
jgi:hypothetical protein